HPAKTPFAAAVIEDATTFSYPQYLLTVAAGAAAYESERNHGGSPWQNPQKWRQEDVLFNSDHVKAATLFMYHGSLGRTAAEMSSIDIGSIGAMKANQAPFDYVFLPGAGHAITRPQ